MHLETLTLRQFRSYHQKKFSFHPQLNMVIGPNGSGKTNLLEAVYVLAVTKSFRARDDELIEEGYDWFSLLAESKGSKRGLKYKTTPRREKSIDINGQSTTTEEYIQNAPVVLFEPGDVAIVSGAPSVRRGFLDSVLARLDTEYFRDLVQYKRVLKQRNALLRSGLAKQDSELFAWDVKLAELGERIYQKRMEFVDYINKYTPKLYAEISGQKINIMTTYESSCKGDNYATQLLAALQRHRERDAILKSTGDGPHRDDVRITVDERLIQTTASRGEARTLVLAYKLIELKFIEEKIKEQPLLLFDDVFSELDSKRCKFLLQQMKSYQSIITTTDTHGGTNLSKHSHAIIKLGDQNARRRSSTSSQKNSKS